MFPFKKQYRIIKTKAFLVFMDFLLLWMLKNGPENDRIVKFELQKQQQQQTNGHGNLSPLLLYNVLLLQ